MRYPLKPISITELFIKIQYQQTKKWMERFMKKHISIEEVKSVETRPITPPGLPLRGTTLYDPDGPVYIAGHSSSTVASEARINGHRYNSFKEAKKAVTK